MNIYVDVMQRKLIVIFVLCCCLLALASCTSSVPESKPMPELTYEHIEALPVKVARIEIDNRYESSAPHDASSSFPTPPDIALRRYAENKLKASGSEGTFKFIIDGANIRHSLIQPAGKFTGWMGVGRKDLFEVNMKIRMFVVDGAGKESTHSILNMRRSISIPQRYSLSEKEQEKLNFLELLMKDVDEAVTKTLREKMNVVGYDLDVPTTALLAAPEIGRE